MKVTDIAYEYNFDANEIRDFLIKNLNYNGNCGVLDMDVKPKDVNVVIRKFRGEDGEDEETIALNKALSEILITSGFNFDGYRVTKYSGYISGDDCEIMPRDDFWGNNRVEEKLCDTLVKIRRQALGELKEAAYNLGCNAVIEVDFDYIVMDPQHSAALNHAVTVYEPYVICVTANGNAVVIEKDE